MSNSIIDQQQQDFVMILSRIEVEAAKLAGLETDGYANHIQTLAALIEGLAQATRQLYIQQQQGWAPVLEDKR